MKIEILPGQNNPKTNESVHEELKKCNWGETTFDIKVSGAFKRHTADVAHLKSAYLAAFAKFGYRWLFTSSTDIIREQIQNPERKIIEGARTYIKDTNDQEYSFGLAEKPFPFLFALMGESAVFLPWLEQDSNELYSWTKESRANDKPLKFRFIDKWTWPESMELALDQL